ncbi:MAG: c-type cytochrome [Chloroflexi bacterium]|nr:c-type cytochrome [Chloroflexota bacterium]
MMKKVFFGVLVLSAIVLAACGGSSNATPIATVPAEYAGATSPLGPDAATAGAEVSKTNCESCHGPQGHGDGPAGAALDPAPKNLPDLAAQVGDDYLYWRINTGKEGTAMVAWKGVLTDEQIWHAVAFIRTLK